MSCDGTMIGLPCAGERMLFVLIMSTRASIWASMESGVHGHLVAVEVGVEGGADERVELDRLALDEDRLERLDAEAVERRGAVQEHRVLADHLVEDVPDLGALLLHHLLRALDGGDVALLLELVVDERLEQLERHDLRQAALVQLELRADHDHGAARVVDALAEQVLAEPALLALQHVAERLERALVRAGDGLAAPAVVEERVDRLLQHPLLVADDDVGGVELLEPLQAVVAVDDAPVEVVQVGGREPAAVERDERAEIGRDDRDDLEHHPLRPPDWTNASTTLSRFAIFFRFASLVASFICTRSSFARPCRLAVALVGRADDEELEHRLAAHAGEEGLVPELLERLVVAVLGEARRAGASSPSGR